MDLSTELEGWGLGELPVGTALLTAPHLPDRIWEVDFNNRKTNNLDIKVKTQAGQPLPQCSLGLRFLKWVQHHTPFFRGAGRLLGLRDGLTHLGPTSPESSGD